MTLCRTLGFAALSLCVASCSGSDETLPLGVLSRQGTMQLERVEYGRLVDIYGLRQLPQGRTVIALYQRDVVIDPTLGDERLSSERGPSSAIEFDFIASDLDRQMPRLLIERPLGSESFAMSLARATNGLRRIEFGRMGQSRPATLVPRDAAIKLSFDAPLNVDRDFFERRDPEGRVIGLRNPSAIRLGVMKGNPDAGGRTQGVPLRYIIGRQSIVLDPVLTGLEGPKYQIPNRVDGLPSSEDSLQPNLRLALALTGPLAMVGLTESDPQRRSVSSLGTATLVCDFRSGRESDESFLVGRGFLRDPRELTLIGQVPLGVLSIAAAGEDHLQIKISKQDAVHEIDRGDSLVLYDETGAQFGKFLVVAEPSEDEGKAEVQRVTLLVARFETSGQADLIGRTGLRSHLEFEFTAGRRDGSRADDPSYALSYGERVPLDSGADLPPAQYISPLASIEARFNRAVDSASVDGLETFFVATRDVLSPEAIDKDFFEHRGLDPSAVSNAKFRTPHLVVSRVFEAGQAGTQIRLTPVLGLYLDEEVRLDEFRPFAQKRYRYYVHLLAGEKGITDRTGYGLDLGARSSPSGESELSHLSIPFSLDTRMRASGMPMYLDNRVVYVVRRFADEDEDERPSIYRHEEMQPLSGVNASVDALPSRDLFGAVGINNDGRLHGRPTSRIRMGIDGMIGQRLGACPAEYKNRSQIWSQRSEFSQPLATPLNHYGSRLQTVYREIDLGLSFEDPGDFDLDVEALYWAPFAGSVMPGETFDKTSLYLGHSEFRPEPCIGQFSSLLAMPASGLQSLFEDNYAGNRILGAGGKSLRPEPHLGYSDSVWRVEPTQAIADPGGGQQDYLPFPSLQKPYLVWRDQRALVQGGNSQVGSDVRNANQADYDLYLPSPFAGGRGRVERNTLGGIARYASFWGNTQEYSLQSPMLRDQYTGGGVASVALPLLLDLWTYPDDNPSGVAPSGGGDFGGQYRGPGDTSLGLGWQTSIFSAGSTPNFRAFSTGLAGVGAQPPVFVDPSRQTWQRASGGYNPTTGNRVGLNSDSTTFWLVADFLKRQSVAVAGFVELDNPHRMPVALASDPRLGPYTTKAAPDSFVYGLGPNRQSRAAGSRVEVEFRAAGPVDDDPWRWRELNFSPSQMPDAANFPLDPLKAGDAALRKYDDRLVGSSQARDSWTHYYNRNITGYTREPAALFEESYLRDYRGSLDQFAPDDLRYLNWRFIFVNDTEAKPPKTPSLDAFWIAYRLH